VTGRALRLAVRNSFPPGLGWWAACLLLGCTPEGVDKVPLAEDDDADDDGWIAAEDCDDLDPAVYPGAAETWYDGVDQDCDGNDDDQDGDGWALAEDCDDEDPDVSPAAAETWYDGVDQDCDGNDDDQDGDGWALAEDCDDEDAAVHPAAAETWYDGVDQDCDGNDDDQDGDGWAVEQDCEDSDPSVNPGATETCDGRDQDCDGLADDGLAGDYEACPAESCHAIHLERPDAGDGTYWIEVDGTTYEVLCDMTNDDGGWTLVANFVWPGSTAGVSGWTTSGAVGASTTDTARSFKLPDSTINSLVLLRYRGHGTATTCNYGPCTVNTTLYWAADCVYDSTSASTGACTAAFQTYDLQGSTELSSPCSWHYGLTSADCGVTSEFGSSHEGDHVFVGIVGTYTHAYDGRDGEDPDMQVWVK